MLCMVALPHAGLRCCVIQAEGSCMGLEPPMYHNTTRRSDSA